MYLCKFSVLLDGQSMQSLQDFLEIFGPYSLDDVTSTISSLDGRHLQPRLVSLGLEYVPNTFRCSIQLLKRPPLGSPEEKSTATASAVAVRILSIMHFLIMNISPLLTIIRICWFAVIWLIVATDLLFFGALERFGLPLQTSLPKIDCVLKTELDKKTYLNVRLNNVPGAHLPSISQLRKTWKLGFRFSFDFDFEFDCEVVKVCGSSIKVVLDSSSMLPTGEELLADALSVVLGEYVRGKKNWSVEGSRNLFALTVKGKRLDVFLREVVISASVYFKLKGYIESHMQPPSRAPHPPPQPQHHRASSGPTATTAAESLFTTTNPLVTDTGGSASLSEGTGPPSQMDLASLIAVDFAVVNLCDQSDQRLADASSLHLSLSSWYPTQSCPSNNRSCGGSGSDKGTYYNPSRPVRTEGVALVDQLCLFSVPADEGHRLLVDGLTARYASTSSDAPSLSTRFKQMAPAGRSVVVQCQRVSATTTEDFLDHCLQELSLRTIRYFCFGLNYLRDTLLAGLEVSVRAADVSVEVVCCPTGDLLSSPTQPWCGAIVDGCGGREGEGQLLAGSLHALRVGVCGVECEVGQTGRCVAFYAQDLHQEVVELEMEMDADWDSHSGGDVGTMVDNGDGDVYFLETKILYGEYLDQQRLIWTLD